MGSQTLRAWVVVVFALCTSACGGGGGGTSAPPVPDVALLFVSGHEGILDGEPSRSYLDESDEVGPAVIQALQAQGYSLSADYFVDNGTAVAGFGGYVDLVDAMEFIESEWAPRGTRTVVICHSHGGVWAHEAIRRVPGLPITCLVDLDCSSYGWGSVGHDEQNYLIDGDPRDAWSVGGIAYDSEDVVFDSVVWELEVRSGDSPLIFSESYDESWNVRLDGSIIGLDRHFSDTDHTEVHKAWGVTVPFVIQWLTQRLAL